MKLAQAIKRAKRTYIIGNGGSYANAVHIANDLLSCGIRAHTLDPATLTAFANDFGYDTVFERWLLVVGEPGDLLIALSGSGKSPNVLKGLDAARKIGMNTWALVGMFSGGLPQAARIARNFTCEGTDMQAAENAQLATGHAAMRWLKVHHVWHPRLHPDIDIIGDQVAYQQ